MKKSCLLLVLIPSLVIAAEHHDEDPCTVQGGGVTAGYLCAEQKLNVAEQELELAYQLALKRVKIEQSELRETFHMSLYEIVKPFQQAQQSWRVYRDSQCEFVGTSSTTSAWQSVQIESCKIKMTQERTQYLKQVFVG